MVKIFQVDAFTDRLFGGNPAAVVPFETWPTDTVLQAIAMENNLAETAYIVPADSDYELRWFTPLSEVALCGHATLASAHVLIKHLGYEKQSINFLTRKSATLTVTKQASGLLAMSFPSIPVRESNDLDMVALALGVKPSALYTGNYSADEFDYMAVFASESQVAELAPIKTQFRDLKSRGVIATAAGDHCDFVSRYFAPNIGIDEDPVTGSAHCLLAPYWAQSSEKTELQARQISKRGGVLGCEVVDDKTIITGRCIDYLQGEIDLNGLS